MYWLVRSCAKLAGWMSGFSGIVVFLMMLVTVTDVVLRFFGKPIFGSYEIICVAGATVIAFAFPTTSLERGNISVDFLIDRSSASIQKVSFVVTRILGLGLFVGVTWFLFRRARLLYEVREVTSILQIPRYFITYALTFCCFTQCIALITEVIKVIQPKENNNE